MKSLSSFLFHPSSRLSPFPVAPSPKQQRATLAEKEVITLKEKLVNCSSVGRLKTGSSISMAPPAQDTEDPAPGTPNPNPAPNSSPSPGSQSQSGGGGGRNVDIEAALATKDKEIAELVDDVQSLKSSLSQMRETSASQIRLLEAQLESKQEMITRLEALLDAQRDYEELKRQLTLLKMATSAPDSQNNTTENSLNNFKDVGKGLCLNSPRFTMCSGSVPAEAFGTLLGEELVTSWRRSLERSLLSSSSSPTPQQQQQQAQQQAQQQQSQSSSLLPSHHPQHPLQQHQHHTSLHDSWSPPTNHSSMGDSSPTSMTGDNNMSPLNGSANCGSNDRLPFRFEDSLIPKSDPMEAKLQEMLRYNMDKFGSQCLDTLQIARRVRELLSIHNIGQRLFAKYVLGLSQGTVSELLSKPKPWDKLTEKGRDSYRKMHAWAADEASVLLLKSLIPKKGKEGTSTNGSLSSSLFRCGGDDSSIGGGGGPDDRIAHILAEANALHRAQQNDCDRESGGSKSPTNNNCQGPGSPSSSSSRDRKMKKYEHDDISQEQVTRIYHEELAKLVGISRLQQQQQQQHGHQGLGGHGINLDAEHVNKLAREHYPSLVFPSLFGGNLLEREDLRVAIDTYHREIVKQIASNSTGGVGGPPSPPYPSNLFHISIPNGGISAVQDLSLPKRLSSPPQDDDDDDDSKFDRDRETDTPSGGGGGGGGQVGSAFSLVRPKGSGGSSSGAPSPLSTILPPSGGSDDCSTASPLQRMASITNSLISQPSTPSVSSPSQRPLKAVLPPITQQQFDQYNNLNTEEIVRKVKEQLSQYSISQRLFGESVLGLSQGSVSDLLARPKPWHMLTQKGREPFIRMKMFLEDDNAVHKLVASQYKIAPEKLMRTGGYSGNPSTSVVPSTLCKNSTKGVGDLPKNLDLSPLPCPPQPTVAAAQTPTPKPPIVIKQEPAPKEMSINSQSSLAAAINMHSHVHAPSASAAVGLAQQHSVYEMAALTQDLDTQLITTKIKEALLANNIGQKIFGEVVLGLSQGSVSELLSKPKPWHMLSIKGREPFIRMQLWLTDPLNVERLQLLKNERREANKRKRGLPYSSSPLDSYNSGVQGSSDNSNDSQNDSYSPASSAAPPPSKKQRVLFTEEQKEALRLGFALDPYPNVSAIEFLARELGLSPRTITNWFHNHRMRLKQSTSLGVQDSSLPSSTPFDPTQFRLLFQQRLLAVHKELYSMQSPDKHALNAAASAAANAGLDLSVNFGRSQSDNEDEYFEDDEDENENDIENSTFSDESSTSSASKLYKRKRSHSATVLSTSCSNKTSLKDKNNMATSSSGSSRRKPVAPQWLNPSWKDDSDDDDVVININGVCVLQNTATDSKLGTSGEAEQRADGDEDEENDHDHDHDEGGGSGNGKTGGTSDHETSSGFENDNDNDNDNDDEELNKESKTLSSRTRYSSRRAQGSLQIHAPRPHRTSSTTRSHSQMGGCAVTSVSSELDGPAADMSESINV